MKEILFSVNLECMRIVFSNLLLIIYVLFVSQGSIVLAQSSSVANCDLCGYCNGGTVPSTWERCVKCIYPDVALGGVVPGAIENKTLIGVPTPHPDKYYTLLGCLSTDPGIFTTQIAQVVFSIIGGIAFLYLIYGAGILIISRSDPEKLVQGKRIIFGALAGLIFVLFSTFIIRFIAVDVLRVPGFSESTVLPTVTPTP